MKKVSNIKKELEYINLYMYKHSQPKKAKRDTIMFLLLFLFLFSVKKSMRNFSGKLQTYAHTANRRSLQCHSAINFGLHTIMQVDHTLHTALFYIHNHGEN